MGIVYCRREPRWLLLRSLSAFAYTSPVCSSPIGEHSMDLSATTFAADVVERVIVEPQTVERGDDSTAVRASRWVSRGRSGSPGGPEGPPLRTYGLGAQGGSRRNPEQSF